MENQKKKQERELRALTQEELVSVNGGNGGEVYIIVTYVNGVRVITKVTK